MAVKKHRSFFSLLFSTLLCASLLISCVSRPPEEEVSFDEVFPPAALIWENVSEEISLCNYEDSRINLYCHIAKIDLRSKNLELTACPEEESLIKGGYFKSPGLKKFLQKTGSFLAVNASPFSSPLSGHLSILTSKRKNIGIFKVDGKELYPPAERYDAVTFSKNEGSNRSYDVDFVSQKDRKALDEARWAFGGFWINLKNSSPLSFNEAIHNGRTSLALSEDKNTLFILNVEKKGRGLSFGECARLLLAAGATDALQMDGGPFAGLYINGSEEKQYGQRFTCGSIIGFILK